MLCDMGADVVKFESPEGDLTRYSAPRVNSMATYFVQQNVGKRSVSVDLTVDGATEFVHRLVQQADVLVENFRPDVMGRLGLGAEEMLKLNPRLIYASINGYGSTGPWVDRRAYASVVGGESGFTLAQAAPLNREPANDPHSHADVYTGIETAYAIVSALFQRERTGRGQWINVSMAETMLYVNEHVHNHLYEGDVDPSWIRSFQPGEYPIIQFEDGTHAVVSGHPAENGTFDMYVKALGVTSLATDPRFVDAKSRLANIGALFQEIQNWANGIADFDTAERLLSDAGLAVGRMRTVSDIASTEWASARNAIVAVSDRGDGEIRIPNAPWHFSGAATGVQGVPKYRGEDNQEVASDWLGLVDSEVQALQNKGILNSRVPGLRKDVRST
jgi:CoA:oxalate CoA-transferase